MITYIADTAHYNEVLSRVARVGASREPFHAVLDILVRRRVDVRLLHAKEPGPNFRDDFDRYPALWGGLYRLCESDGCGHRNEERRQAQLRGGYSDR